MRQVIVKTLELIRQQGRISRWILLLLLAVFASALEMVGALLVFLLLGLVADPEGSLAIPLLGDLRRFLGDLSREEMLLGIAAVMALFFVMRFVVQVGVVYAQKRVAHRAGARLAKRLVVGYLSQPYEFHLHRSTSDLIRVANSATGPVVMSAFVPLIRVSAEAILVAGLLSVMLLISPIATLLAVAVVGGAAALLLFVVQPRLKRLGKTVYQMNQATLGALQQALHGLRDIKLLGRERFFAHGYGDSVDALTRANYLRGTITELPRHVMEAALVGFILGFFAVSVLRDQATQEVLSVLGLFAYVGLRLQPSLNKVVSSLNELKFAGAAIEGLHEDLHRVTASPIPGRPSKPLELEQALRAEDVDFRYSGSDELALQEVNIEIAAGQTIGICGPTGSGKTTLVDLLTGLLEPTGGRITIDGRDLRQCPREWQANLGVVPQMVFLIDDTLRRNIALGVPDDEIDEAAVQRAVDLSQLEEFVQRVPQGLDTMVGERGVRISGGQRQRIAIARALYRGAGILVFDEGTSALDNTTEAELMRSLERLRDDHTVILVAHRLSTVRNCDRIFFVEAGRVASSGTYDELLATSPGFRALTNT